MANQDEIKSAMEGAVVGTNPTEKSLQQTLFNLGQKTSKFDAQADEVVEDKVEDLKEVVRERQKLMEAEEKFKQNPNDPELEHDVLYYRLMVLRRNPNVSRADLNKAREKMLKAQTASFESLKEKLKTRQKVVEEWLKVSKGIQKEKEDGGSE